MKRDINFLFKFRGRTFRHFKCDNYLLIDIAEHTETGEILVLYKALYGQCKIYARPIEMFLSKVDRVKYPNVTQEYRLEPIALSSVKE